MCSLSFHILSILIALVSVSVFTIIFLYLKKNGFEKTNIKPYNFLTNISFKEFLVILKNNNIICKFVDDDCFYALFKNCGIDYRLLVMNFSEFSKEAYKQKKQLANKSTNKNENINHTSRLANQNKVRINIIFVQRFNEHIYKLCENNANNLFSRVESVLNVFISNTEHKCMFPAHFGLSKAGTYKKTTHFLLKLLSEKEFN